MLSAPCLSPTPLPISSSPGYEAGASGSANICCGVGVSSGPLCEEGEVCVCVCVCVCV